MGSHNREYMTLLTPARRVVSYDTTVRGVGGFLEYQLLSRQFLDNYPKNSSFA